MRSEYKVIYIHQHVDDAVRCVTRKLAVTRIIGQLKAAPHPHVLAVASINIDGRPHHDPVDWERGSIDDEFIVG